MKLLLCLFSCLFTLPAFAINELNVPSGATYTVSASQQRMMLSSLKIGDGAIIRLGEGVKQWQLRADSAEIGQNVTIDATGLPGTDGEPGVSLAATQAKSCQDGKSGAKGGDGTNGMNGRAVRLQLGLVKFGSLNIVSNGGEGGRGGDGGEGQASAPSDGCKRNPKGGDGGDGGASGDGGSGGDITVSLWAADTAINIEQSLGLISTSVQPGPAGQAGNPGKPGAGSEGQYIKKKTLSGNRAWVSGGDAGAKGKDGERGRNGLSGRVLVEQAIATVPMMTKTTAPARQSTSHNRDEEIKLIKQQLKALMQRVDALEQ